MTTEEQIRQLQDKIHQLQGRVAELPAGGAGGNPRPWQTEERDNIRLYQGAVKCVPIFSGERGKSWRSHEKSLKVWFSANSVETYSNVQQQKMAVLKSLRGKALRAQELYGTGTDAYNRATTFEEYLAKI